jgi:hypothetical protein
MEDWRIGGLEDGGLEDWSVGRHPPILLRDLRAMLSLGACYSHSRQRCPRQPLTHPRQSPSVTSVRWMHLAPDSRTLPIR